MKPNHEALCLSRTAAGVLLENLREARRGRPELGDLVVRAHSLFCELHALETDERVPVRERA